MFNLRRPVPRVLIVAITALVALAATLVATPSSGAIDRPSPALCLSQLDVTDLGPDGAYGMTIDPVNGRVYVGVYGIGEVKVLDPVTNDVVDTVTSPTKGGSNAVDFVAIDHADDTLYVSSFSDDMVYPVDISTDTPIGAGISVEDPQNMALNTATNRLYVAGQTSNVTVINTVTNTAIGTLAVGGNSQNVALDPATNRVFVTDFTNGTLDVFNGATNAFIDSHDLPGPVGNNPVNLAYDRTADSVWVTTRNPGRVEEVDADTGAIGVSFAFTAAQGLAINPSIGQGYVTPSNGSTLLAFRLADGQPIDTFGVGDDSIVAVSKVDPVRVYASGLGDGTVTIIGTGNGPFPDVSGANAFCKDIFWLTDNEITTGFDDGTYRPVASVTRQSMAAFLYRFANEPAYTPPVVPSFSDVPLSHPFFKEIEWLADEEVSGGFDDGSFRPGAQITRQAMAAFLYRTINEPVFIPPVTPTFTDVPTTHPFFKEIEWLASTGIAGGFPDGTYRPGSPVTRQAMAAFLHRFAGLF